MSSRIIITDKGRKFQRDLSTELSPHNPVDFPRSSAASGFYTPQATALSKTQSSMSMPTQFSTKVKPRGGYFGPKKMLKDLADPLSHYKPPYFPNYLRKNAEDYPSEFFKHLTPQGPLLHMRTHSSTISDKELFLMKKPKPIDTSIYTNKDLPIRYVHHTKYPYTLPDKPRFAQSPNVTQSASMFMGKSKTRTLSFGGLTPERGDSNHSPMLEDQRNLAPLSKYEEFGWTMMSENNTVVTSHFSKKVCEKYDNQKLSRLKTKHIKHQKEFQQLLGSVENKYQRKKDKLEENLNLAPEYLKKLHDAEERLEDAGFKRENEKKRFKQRIGSIQKDKYKQGWNNLSVACKTHKPSPQQPSMNQTMSHLEKFQQLSKPTSIHEGGGLLGDQQKMFAASSLLKLDF